VSEEANKAVVRRVVDEVMNGRDFEAIDALFTHEAGRRARAAFEEFLEAFPDWQEEVVVLVAEGSRVAARLTCAGTQRGTFMGREPTNRHMKVDEVFFFEFEDDRIGHMWGLEDTWERLRQLGQLPTED
jgi:predicted ester cyclase